MRFTALLHHIYNVEMLRMAYFSLKKEAAPGVDGETWRHYGEELEVASWRFPQAARMPTTQLVPEEIAAPT